MPKLDYICQDLTWHASITARLHISGPDFADIDKLGCPGPDLADSGRAGLDLGKAHRWRGIRSRIVLVLQVGHLQGSTYNNNIK